MTTVQDIGRTGYQSQGFGTSGVMDVRSFKIANMLIDNPENEAVLEFTMIGPTLEFTSETIIAITGGDFQPLINKKPAQMYTAIYINKGDVLEFQGARTGVRGYIAFSCYLNIPVIMGSRSTNIKCRIGGFKGRNLKEGDYISFRIRRRYLPYFLSRTLDLDEFNQEDEVIRVIMGPQDNLFTNEGKKTFLNSEFTIQVPAHGKPIILLADRQTTGGYPKIATVATVDLPKLVQRKADHKIRFKAISVEEAQNLLIEEMNEFTQFRKKIHAPCKEVLDVRFVSKRLETLFE